jgi:hypothetical protein
LIATIFSSCMRQFTPHEAASGKGWRTPCHRKMIR